MGGHKTKLYILREHTRGLMMINEERENKFGQLQFWGIILLIKSVAYSIDPGFGLMSLTSYKCQSILSRSTNASDLLVFKMLNCWKKCSITDPHLRTYLASPIARPMTSNAWIHYVTSQTNGGFKARTQLIIAYILFFSEPAAPKPLLLYKNILIVHLYELWYSDYFHI